MIDWNAVIQKDKPINIYESKDLIERYLSSKNIKESTKKTYLQYFYRFAEYLREHEMTTINEDEVITYLRRKRDTSGPKQARSRLDLLNNYCLWLVKEGKLNNNPWSKVNPDELGLGYGDIKKYLSKVKAEKLRREAAKLEAANKEEPKESESDTSEKKFTLSDVALLLIAIEDGDQEGLLSILNK